jgi:hypothetical protein
MKELDAEVAFDAQFLFPEENYGVRSCFMIKA